MNPDLFDRGTITTSSISTLRSKPLAQSLENSCLLLGLLACMQSGEDLEVTANNTSDSLLKYYCLSCHADPTRKDTNGKSTREPAILPIFHQEELDEHVWHSLLHTIADSDQIGQCWRKLEKANNSIESLSSMKQLDELDLEGLSAQISFEDKSQILTLLIDRIIVRCETKTLFVEGPIQSMYGDTLDIDLPDEIYKREVFITTENKELLARIYGYLLRQARLRKLNNSLVPH